MQIGKKHKTIPKEDVLFLDWLFYFYDHVGSAHNVWGNNLCACGLVFVVRKCGELAGAGFDQHFVSCFSERLYACGSNSDAALVVFDFLWYSNDHVSSLENFLS